MPTIKEWNRDDQPREKMLMKGVAALSDAELMAIIVQNGTINLTALDLAKQLLMAAGNNLQKLGTLTVPEIVGMKIRGLGQAKAIIIAAALELGTRRNITENRKEIFRESRDVAHFLKSKLQHLQHEVFAVVYLNHGNKIMHFEFISEGGMTGTIADPRIVLKKALLNNATNIILSHNHPSGNIKPSKADKELTSKMVSAASFFDIKVLDHIIVGEDGYFSFADNGLL
jgi:DNA repair protein RadC